MKSHRWYRKVRATGGRVKRWLQPRPEVAAWQHACRQSEVIPRYTPGSIDLMGYRLEYTDLLTVCPQWNGIFVRESLKFRAANDRPRILDCGANVGLAALYFKRLYPQARIISFEADPAIHRVLANNLASNKAGDAEAVAAAVWTQNATIPFHCEGADSGAITASPSDDKRIQNVPCVRLRDYLVSEPVDLLKLDIEGAESDVLDDCEDALDNVSAMLLDLHEFAPQSRTTPRVLDRLARAGFTYALDDLCTMPWRTPVAGEDTPFPKAAMCWAFLVRAWRE